MPRGRTYVGSAQAVGIGSRPSAVDLGASGLNLPGCHVMVKKSVRPRRFIRGVPGEQSKQRLQGMKGMLRTRERMSRLPKTCCHMSWASVMAAAMLRRCVACFLTGQKKSRDKPEFIHWCCNSGTQYHGNAVLYTMLQHFAGNDAFSYLKSFNELSQIIQYSGSLSKGTTSQLHSHNCTALDPAWEAADASSEAQTSPSTKSIIKQNQRLSLKHQRLSLKQEQGDSSDNK